MMIIADIISITSFSASEKWPKKISNTFFFGQKITIFFHKSDRVCFVTFFFPLLALKCTLRIEAFIDILIYSNLFDNSHVGLISYLSCYNTNARIKLFANKLSQKKLIFISSDKKWKCEIILLEKFLCLFLALELICSDGFLIGTSSPLSTSLSSRANNVSSNKIARRRIG